jgi:hypothetical protein
MRKPGQLEGDGMRNDLVWISFYKFKLIFINKCTPKLTQTEIKTIPSLK